MRDSHFKAWQVEAQNHVALDRLTNKQSLAQLVPLSCQSYDELCICINREKGAGESLGDQLYKNNYSYYIETLLLVLSIILLGKVLLTGAK